MQAVPQEKAVSLRQDNLTLLKDRIQTPEYDRANLTTGIVHLGVGGFHRAHQANYVDMFLRKNPDACEWGIFGVGTLPVDKTLQENLAAQNYLYTLLEVDEKSCNAKIIGSIIDGCLAPANPQAVIDKIAQKETRIVSLSVTTNGYYTNIDTMVFNIGHADIQHDLSNPGAPKTVPGLILYGLAKRKYLDLGGLTVLSCDNLPANGEVTRTAILSMAEKCDAALKTWIEENVTFPSCMVDRITPVPTPAESAFVAETLNIEDRCAVKCEPFLQWIVEDDFKAGRPALETVGVQFVDSATPYEEMKMRLLNASHSALAYPGMLFDKVLVDEAMRDQDIVRYTRGFMDELTPTIPQLPGIDLTQYKDTLISRFSNPQVGDQLARVGKNGSLKFPKFLFAALEENIKSNRPTVYAAAAIALWVHYMKGKTESSQPIKIDDSNSGKIAALGTADAILTDFLSSSAAFAPFKQQTLGILAKIEANGARNVLAALPNV